MKPTMKTTAAAVMLNYPAAEKTPMDRVVTRISHSLSGG